MFATPQERSGRSDPLREPWARSLPVAGGAAATAAVSLGVLAAATSPLVALAAVVGLAGLALVLARPLVGLFGFIVVVATLPLGVVPLRVGVQLTLVDVVLIATYLGLALHLLGGRRRLVVAAPELLVVLFAVVAIVAFVAGGAFGSTTPETGRRFAKLIASLLFFVVASTLLRGERTLTAAARALVLAGAFAGAVGAGLWLLPPATQESLLGRLSVVGYPTTDILRFEPGENQTYSDRARATGTAVDPNVFGGTLMLPAALLAIQWLAPPAARLFGAPALLLLSLPTLAGLLLSFSRASWVGLVVGVLVVGRRHRRLWVAAVLAGVLLLALPFGQRLVTRFVGGLSTADPATALRLGEYRNALTIIQRYPLLGIGYGQSPEIDVTAGVSSVYLLVGEQDGLTGLSLYLAALGATYLAGSRALAVARRRGRRSAGQGSPPAAPQLAASPELRRPGRGPAGVYPQARATAASAHEQAAARTTPRDWHDRPGGARRIEPILEGTLAAFTAALVAGLADHYFANLAFPHAVALFWLYAALMVAAARHLAAPPPSSGDTLAGGPDRQPPRIALNASRYSVRYGFGAIRVQNQALDGAASARKHLG